MAQTMVEWPPDGAAATGAPAVDPARRQWPRFLAALLCTLPLAWAMLSLTYGHALGAHTGMLALDFTGYYTGGHMLLHGVRSELYDLDRQSDWQRRLWPEMNDPALFLPYLTPPFVAIPLALVAGLPPEGALAAWTLLNALLLAAICCVVMEAVEGGGRRAPLWALLLCLTFLPVMGTVMQGQLSFLLTLGLLLSWRAFRAGRDGRAGLWLALLLVKPHFALVPAALLLWQRRFRALAGLAFAGSGLLAVSLALVGWSGLASYVGLLLNASSWGFAYGMDVTRMHTWSGTLHLWLGTRTASEIRAPWLLGCAVALGLVAWAWRGPWRADRPAFDLQWALMIVAMLFCSPHLLLHDLSLLVVPGALTVRYVNTRRAPRRLDRALRLLPLAGYLTLWIWIGVLAATGRWAPLSVLCLGVTLVALTMAVRRPEAQPR